MGSSRKLQGEIDRVLKKVQEGVDVFDSIWNKVYDTENANQKEKFEADLKKEIKKLQRYRDQIKTWIQSSEIKEKKALLDARKLIEREMERFKVCEKETKTKAFSKEGLGQQPKTDPREKAKSESRDWLNNMVGDLESQIDSFEAEMEGLSVKKGKARPPRLTHLEDSISRHKQHVTKLELILRLLENDGLSPEEVNDVKEYIEDYVERNQDNFEEFEDVEDLYQSLPLDKLEALEAKEAIPVVASSIVVKEKGAVAAASGTPSANGSSLKSPVATPAAQTGAAVPAPAAAAAVTQHDSPSSPDPKEGAYQEDSGIVSGKPPSHTVQPNSVSLGSLSKEEDAGNFSRKLLTTSIGDTGLARGGLGQVTTPELSPPRLGVLSSVTGSVSGDDDAVVTPVSESRLGNGGLAQQLATPPGSQDRGIAQPMGLLDSGLKSDSVSVSEGGIIGGRIFSPSVGGQWRLSSASSFQSQPDMGQYHGRTEIAPDQKQKYLQRLQEHQQGHSAASLLSAAAAQLSQLASADQRPQGLSPPQHKLQLQSHHPHEQQQVSISQNSRLSPLQQHSGLSPGLQLQQHLPSTPGQQLGQPFTKPQSPHQLRPGLLSQQGSSKDHLDSEASLGMEEVQFQSSQPRPAEGKNGTNGTSLSASFHRSASLTEDDSKNADTFDVVVGDPGTLAELSQLSRDSREVDFPTSHGMRAEPPKGLGVIGRRSVLESGAKTELLGTPSVNTTMHEQAYNKMALDAAYANIPSSKDSERPKSYIPKFPASTPASYPQVPAPIIENPALWERLETDVLFLAFYYQQGTFQQYLAARELKKQSWRYHKKYNTWFQRHQEPKIANEEFEQGTYVYFDFHIVPDDFQQGWCQRIKSEFTFEYSYLEDELVL